MRNALRAACRAAAQATGVLAVTATASTLAAMIVLATGCASSHSHAGRDDGGTDDAAIIPVDADTRLGYGDPCTDGSQCMSGFCLRMHPPDPGTCSKQC